MSPSWHGTPIQLSSPQAHISHYADSVAFHLAKILESDKHSVVISSAKYGGAGDGLLGMGPTKTPLFPSLPAASLVRFLCGTVNDFVAEVGRAYKRATENKQEAELMARKVGSEGLRWGPGGVHAVGLPKLLGCPGKYGILKHLGCPGYPGSWVLKLSGSQVLGVPWQTQIQRISW